MIIIQYVIVEICCINVESINDFLFEVGEYYSYNSDKLSWKQMYTDQIFTFEFMKMKIDFFWL
jgi:hypothetical protein